MDDTLGPRASWLRQTLLDDNLVQLRREPDRVADKLRKMASTPYRWFRGSLAQHLRDATTAAGPAATPVRTPGPISGSAATGVSLVGDPHPENLGTFVHDGAMTVAFNDFDGAGYGPFWFDVRRLALGFATFAVGTEHGLIIGGPEDPTGARTLARAVARGYGAEVVRLAEGGPMRRLRIGAQAGKVLNDLMREGAEEGTEGKRLLAAVDLSVPAPRLRPLPADPQVPWRTGQAVVADRAALAAALPDWQESRGDHGPPWQLLDVARRYGSGVSSVALLRFILLVRRGSALRVLEAREVVDAPWRAGMIEAPPRPFTSNGERVVQLARNAHGAVNLDPLQGWTTQGALGLRLRWRTSWHQGLDTAKLAEACRAEEVEPADLIHLAETAGRLLARAHVRAPLRSGGPALPAIAAALAGAPGGLVGDTEAAVAAYLPQVQEDHRLLGQLLEKEGGTLGWRDAPW